MRSHSLAVQLAAPAMLLLATTVALAQDAPRLKPGLWDMKSTFDGGRRGPMTMAMQTCHDETTQRAQWNPAQNAPGQTCSDVRTRRDGAAFVVEADCQREGSTVRSVMRTTMQGDTAFSMNGTITYTPPLKGREKDTIQLEGKYLGACPAGMKPGERKMQGMPGMPSMPERKAP